MSTPMLITAPANTDNITYETLAYVDAYDAVLNGEYAEVGDVPVAAAGVLTSGFGHPRRHHVA